MLGYDTAMHRPIKLDVGIGQSPGTLVNIPEKHNLFWDVHPFLDTLVMMNMGLSQCRGAPKLLIFTVPVF